LWTAQGGAEADEHLEVIASGRTGGIGEDRDAGRVPAVFRTGDHEPVDGVVGRIDGVQHALYGVDIGTAGTSLDEAIDENAHENELVGEGGVNELRELFSFLGLEVGGVEAFETCGEAVADLEVVEGLGYGFESRFWIETEELARQRFTPAAHLVVNVLTLAVVFSHSSSF
jgi:hypothetical protein